MCSAMKGSFLTSLHYYVEHDLMDIREKNSAENAFRPTDMKIRCV